MNEQHRDRGASPDGRRAFGAAREAANLSRQRRFWGSRASSWDHHAANNSGLVRVVERVISLSEPAPGMRVVDLGCGSGQLSIPIARQVKSVLAIDISRSMIDLLEENAKKAGVGNIEGLAAPIERLDIDDSSVDLVVSNYALHHLRDGDKAKVVQQAASWLRPGGRLVVGDMMFGRGGAADDRRILSSKLAVLAKKGPGGWWRIVKNVSRYTLRLQERPVSVSAWVSMFEDAGLEAVTGERVVSEAAVVTGRKPEAGSSKM